MNLTRIMALHALGYCERLFYLEEVEEIRLADEHVHAGRADHAELDLVEGDELKGFELASEAHGLMGKLDAIRHRDGGWTPYEYKRGRACRTPDGKWEAWDADVLQVLAYALLLEEHLGKRVSGGRVRYLASKVTISIQLDDAGREQVRGALERAEQLRQSPLRPPVTTSSAKCAHCSLSPVCLPEEERYPHEPHEGPADPVPRLFPEHQDGQTLHLTRHDLKLGRSAATLTIKDSDGQTLDSRPARELSSIAIHGNAQVTTQALQLCAANNIPVFWFNRSGAVVAALQAAPGGVQRRIRQYQALADPATGLRLARLATLAKVQNTLRYLLRSTRGNAAQRSAAGPASVVMRRSLRAIAAAETPSTIRGHEGLAARAWFDALPALLNDKVPDELRPSGRSRRPPQDPFNALLSFGYGLLYRQVLQSILLVGLEPAFGYFHTPRSAAQPLVLDLMELFRLPLVDAVALGAFNRSQFTSADFAITRTKVWLSDEGRKKAISLFERRLEDTWRHPVLQYSLSYARAIELEVRLLEKEWSGHPGLFAQSRLR